VLRHWNGRPLTELLASNGLEGLTDEPFPNDGWSGSQLTLLRRGTERFVLKRTSWATDWIARATRDHALREAFVAAGELPLPDPIHAPYLGAAGDGSAAAILMPDLSGALFDWERSIDADDLERVLRHVAALHAAKAEPDPEFPWCPLRERLELLTRPSSERYLASGLAVGQRFLEGWDAFDQLADPAARDLAAALSADIGPLLAALERLPQVLNHGDLKLANIGFVDDRMALIDWQMVTRAPVAVELGWLVVSNVASLPEPVDAVLDRYRHAAASAGVDVGDWDAQVDLAVLVGLLLRGWRKGLDSEAATPTGWGATGADDLAWWSRRAVEAADRRL
jgi:aminoglycoside phosphotransferase (APT) family kinase protein